MMAQSMVDPLHLAKANNLIQESDGDVLKTVILKVLEDHPKEVAAYRGGKKQLMGFFMGQVMKASKGKADPKLTSRLLAEVLG